MRRIFVVAALILLTVSSHAAPRRRSVGQPSVPRKLSSWTIEVTTSGGFAPSIRTSIVLRSSGAATLLNHLGQPSCSGSMTETESSQLASSVAQAHPETWASSYLDPSNPNGCCDQIRTSVKLTRTFSDQTTATSESYWFDVHPALPADLSSLYDLAYGASSPRNRIEPLCTSQSAKSWSIEITEDGGAGYRFHQVTVDSSGNVLVKPNLQSSECKYTIDENETQALSNLARNANAAAWASSYARPNNPNGCCDQIKTVVKLTRSEVGPTGSTQAATYTTFWYSDHPTLPSDLTDFKTNAFALFQRFGSQCGPIF